MARTLVDRIERLEDGAPKTALAISLIQQAQTMRLESEKKEDLPSRMDALEALVNRGKGALWLIGILWAITTVLVGILMARGGL